MTEIPGGLAVVRMTLLTDGEQGFAAFSGATLYRIQKATVNERGSENDVTSTGNTTLTPTGSAVPLAVYGDTVVSKVEAEITLVQASYDAVLNLFGAPLPITTGSFLRIEIFPRGLASTPWDFTVVQVTSVDHEIDAAALQPITLKAKTKDVFTRPT